MPINVFCLIFTREHKLLGIIMLSIGTQYQWNPYATLHLIGIIKSIEDIVVIKNK
jgi:hypothetical protein